MKKIIALSAFFLCVLLKGFSQDVTPPKNNLRAPSLGISFFFNDYTTAQRIRATSLSSVLVNKQKAKVSEMSPGFAVSYFEGLTDYVDFSTTLGASFVKYSVNGNAGTNELSLLELDAAINLKLLPDSYYFTPYATLGLGASKYGPHFGAFLPVGVGAQFNLFDETTIFFNSQYRIPVIKNTTAYHFMHGIGIAGVIGNKKERNNRTLTAQ